MFCPKCKTEYIEGIKTCADCNVPLVEELPPVVETVRTPSEPLPPDSGKMVMVFCTDDSHDFIQAAEALKQAGIRVYGDEEFTGEMNMAQISLSPFRWTIYVDEGRALDAREVLEDREFDFIADGPVNGPEADEIGEIAEEIPQPVEQPIPRKSADIAEQSRIVVAGDGSFRKFILLIVATAIIGTIIVLLRK